MKSGRPAARASWAIPLAIAAVTRSSRSCRSSRNGFVSLDDDKNFLDNPNFRGLGPAQLHWMWTTFHMGHYVPLSWMTLGLDYTLWGMNPLGYHLTSLLLHAANAVLVYAIARRLFEKSGSSRLESRGDLVTLGAATAALLFALHPLRVESVAWATERRDVLSAFFALSSILVYLRAVERPASRRRRYWSAVALFACALLSKATTMTVPAVLADLERVSAQATRRDRQAGGRRGDAGCTAELDSVRHAVGGRRGSLDRRAASAGPIGRCGRSWPCRRTVSRSTRGRRSSRRPLAAVRDAAARRPDGAPLRRELRRSCWVWRRRRGWRAAARPR